MLVNEVVEGAVRLNEPAEMTCEGAVVAEVAAKTRSGPSKTKLIKLAASSIPRRQKNLAPINEGYLWIGWRRRAACTGVLILFPLAREVQELRYKEDDDQAHSGH